MTKEEVGALIGDGMVLLVAPVIAIPTGAPPPKGCRLVEYRRIKSADPKFPPRESIPVELPVFEETLPQLAALTGEGTPPPRERKRGQGYKMGWREMGLPDPGDGAAYYLFAQ